MKIRKCLMAVFAFVFFANAAFSQSVDDGIKDLYYQKYQSAKQTLQKVIANKPDDRAYYYLGLADLGLGDKAAAKADFQKGLQVNANSPLNIVGLARIDILDSAYDAGKQKIQKAFDLSEGRDFEVGRAILEATAQSPKADNAYALQLMQQIKANRKNRKKEYTPEDFIAMGDAQRNLPNGGGDAAADYENALALSDDKMAAAYDRLGNLLLGARAFQQVLENYNKAIAADPNYAPAYMDLYEYYRYRDVAKAQEDIEKYMALADDKTNAQVNMVDLLYIQHQYQQAIDKANTIMGQVSDATKTRLYKLMAVSQLASGDSLDAEKDMETYFARGADPKYAVFDNRTYADILMKLNEDSLANIYYAKSIAADTTTNLNALRGIAEDLRKQNNFNGAKLYYQRILNSGKTEVKPIDYFWYGISEYSAGNYDSAVNVFKQMTQKFPDQPSGFYWLGQSQRVLDTAYTGLAVDAYNAYLSKMKSDTSTQNGDNKTQLNFIYSYFGGYYFTKGDYPKAAEYAQKLLTEVDPHSPVAINILYNIAAYYTKQKDRDNAMTYMNQLQTVDSTNAGLQTLVDYWQKMDEYQKKMKAYQEAQRKKAGGGK